MLGWPWANNGFMHVMDIITKLKSRIYIILNMSYIGPDILSTRGQEKARNGLYLPASRGRQRGQTGKH